MWRRKLSAVVADALKTLRGAIGDEHLYAIALYTSGERDFSYVCVSANTDEAVRGPATRWSVPDWKHHDLAAIDVPAGPARTGRARDRRIYESFVATLAAVRLPGVTKVIACGDMSPEFFLRGLRRLNPRRVVDAYVRDHTPAGFFRELGRRPRREQASRLVALLRDLGLERRTREVAEARARNVTPGDVAAALVGCPHAIDGLIDVVSELGLGRTQTAAGWQRSSVAGAAVFVIEDVGRASDAQVARLQEILRRRVSIDGRLARTAPLAENIARVLHTLRPGRFPAAVLDPATSHLRNPEAFS